MQLLISHNPSHSIYTFSGRLLEVFQVGANWYAYEIFPDGFPGLELSYGLTEEIVLSLAEEVIIESKKLEATSSGIPC